MKHLESQLQINCVRWFDLQYPKYKPLLFSIPNEGARTPQNGARMKAMGRRAGTADMFLAMPFEAESFDGYLYHGLFIEFKIGKGKQSDSQVSFEKAVVSQAYRYEIITSFDQFKKLIENYIG
jgi:hypothetical protein